MPEPTAHQQKILTIYVESLLDAAAEVAEKIKDEGVEVEAVAIIVRTTEGWGGQQMAAPEEWGPREEAALYITATQAAVELAGGSMTIGSMADPPVRPLRRRPRRHRPRR